MPRDSSPKAKSSSKPAIAKRPQGRPPGFKVGYKHPLGDAVPVDLLTHAPRVGRPSGYDQKFCDDVIHYRRTTGHSKVAWCGSIGISYECMKDWVAGHSEFSSAVKESDAACAQWWEEKGVGGMESRTDIEQQGNSKTIRTRSLNTGVFAILTRNILDWRDQRNPMGGQEQGSQSQQPPLSDAERSYIAAREAGEEIE